jgi:hypothetical protein
MMYAHVGLFLQGNIFKICLNCNLTLRLRCVNFHILPQVLLEVTELLDQEKQHFPARVHALSKIL